MTYFIASVRKTLLRTLGSPWSMAIWICVPLLVGALLSAVLGGSGTSPKVHMLLADQDKSVLSGALTNALASDQFGEVLVLEPVTETAGKAMLDKGVASALLIIPSGFQDNYLTATQQDLRLIVNPLQSILPEMAEELTRLIADFGSYGQLAFGPEIKAAYAITNDRQTNAGQSEIQELVKDAIAKFSRVSTALGTAPIEVDVVTAEGVREASFLMLLFPGLMMMTVIFTAQGLTEDLWAEREMGTLRRLQSTPASPWVWSAARMMSFGLVLLGTLMPLVLAGFIALGLPVLKLPLALVWTAVAGLMLMQLGSLVQLLAPTRKAGALFATLVFFPLLLVGGSFFPFENMPEVLAAIGRLTPNGMMLEPLKRWLIGAAGLGAFVVPLVTAACLSLVLHVLIAWRLRAGFASS